MPRFEPIPFEELPPTSRQLIEDGMATGMYDNGTGMAPPAMRILAYSNTALRASHEQGTVMWRAGLLDARLVELVRIRSAQVNGCDTCAVAIKDPDVSAEDVACLVSPDRSQLSSREAAALRFVDTFNTDHDAIDDDRLREMLAVFTPAEFVELSFVTANFAGLHRMFHIFRVLNDDPPLMAFDPKEIDRATA
jgi:alkylhydroperoxidase family enzyme